MIATNDDGRVEIGSIADMRCRGLVQQVGTLDMASGITVGVPDVQHQGISGVHQAGGIGDGQSGEFRHGRFG